MFTMLISHSNLSGCSLEDLLRAMDNRDKWRERVREIHAGSAT